MVEYNLKKVRDKREKKSIGIVAYLWQKIKKFLLYFFLPISFGIFELISLFVMSTHTLNSVLLSLNHPQNILINSFWLDGYNNIYVALSIILLFFITSIYVPKTQVYVRGLIVVPMAILVSVIVDLQWLSHGFSYATCGQSGIIFAMFSIVFSFIISDIIFAFINLQYDIMHLNLFLSAFITILIFFNFKGFFNISPNVNYFVHEYSFVYGLVAGFMVSAIQGIALIHEQKIEARRVRT